MKTEIMDESSKKYYQEQLNQIDFHSEFAPLIKITDEKSSTKWMNLNEVSARILVEKLITEYNLDAE